MSDVDTDGTDGTTQEGGGGLLVALKAEREKRQAIAAELEAMRAAQAERERKAAEAAGQHKELYDRLAPELESAKAQLAEFQRKEAARIERLTERNAERLKTLPAHLQDLAPVLDAESLAEWLDKAAKLGEDKRPAGTVAGGASKTAIPAECVAEAHRYGIDPEVWFRGGWQKRIKKT